MSKDNRVQFPTETETITQIARDFAGLLENPDITEVFFCQGGTLSLERKPDGWYEVCYAPYDPANSHGNAEGAAKCAKCGCGGCGGCRHDGRGCGCSCGKPSDILDDLIEEQCNGPGGSPAPHVRGDNEQPSANDGAKPKPTDGLIHLGPC